MSHQDDKILTHNEHAYEHTHEHTFITMIDQDMKKQDINEIRSLYSTLIKTNKEIFTKELMISLWDSFLLLIPEIPGILNIKVAQIRTFILNIDQKELILASRNTKSRSDYYYLAKLFYLNYTTAEDKDKDKNKDTKEDKNKEKWTTVGRQIRESHYSKFSSHAFSGIGLNIVSDKPKHYEKFNNNKEVVSESDKDIKTVIITKPDNWCWNYTKLEEQNWINS